VSFPRSCETQRAEIAIYSIAKFLKLLHKTIQSSLAAGLDDIWENGAKQLQQGWMHIHGEKDWPFCLHIPTSVF
jgi:hypothetical protein